MAMNENENYTFDATAAGVILAPGADGKRRLVTKSAGPTAEDLAAVVRALNVLAKNRKLAKAVRSELKRVHGKAAKGKKKT